MVPLHHRASLIRGFELGHEGQERTMGGWRELFDRMILLVKDEKYVLE